MGVARTRTAEYTGVRVGVARTRAVDTLQSKWVWLGQELQDTLEPERSLSLARTRTEEYTK